MKTTPTVPKVKKQNAQPLLPVVEIWQQRNRDRVLDALKQYQDTCYALGVRLGDSAVLQMQQLESKGYAKQNIFDFLLLEVSFQRSRLELSRAWDRLREIEALYHSSGIGLDFYFYNQCALNHFAQSNYTFALENFTIATSMAPSQSERNLCVFNQVICMEYLGYEYQHFLSQILDDFDLNKVENAQFKDQIQQLHVREMWRDGGLAALSKICVPKNILGCVKTAVFVDWLNHIPHLALDIDSCLGTLREELTQSQNSYMIPYRLRTTQGLLIKEDLAQNIRPTFKIERFYLWVWRWLADPDASKLNRLVQTKKDLARCLTEQLSPDNYELYNLGMRWLAIFCDVADDTVDASLSHLIYAFDRNLPQFTMEGHVIDYLRAHLQCDDTVASDTKAFLESQDIFNKPTNLLKHLVSAVSGGVKLPDSHPLFALANGLISMREARLALNIDRSDGVVVDLLSRTINVFRNGNQIFTSANDGLMRLMALVAKRNLISCMELLYRCFGHNSYDPMVHDARIANLLNKANSHFEPYVSFRRKSGFIHVDVQNGGLSVFGSNAYSESIMSMPDIVEALVERKDEDVERQGAFAATGVKAVSMIESVSSNITGRWLSRHDFEGELGVSRATALRKLQRWIDEKLVTKRGRGRSSRYQISPKLLMEIRQMQKGGEL